MLIPSLQECLVMLDQVHMPDHIRAHSRLVYRVALTLTDNLVDGGVDLNRPLIIAAALLHDITKPRSFETRENHAQTGGEYMTAMGFPEVGDIIRQHVVLDAYFAQTRPVEAEVVNYADKRVLHDTIATLDVRMNYILDRYAETVEQRIRIKVLWDQTRLLEERLFGYLSFSPLQLGDKVDQAYGPE